MKMNVLLLFMLGLTGLKAQEVMPASGGNASGSGGSVSYSVGQVFYNTSTGTNGSESQGVQHPFEIIVITTSEETKDITLCSAFPNPTTDFLTLKVENYYDGNLLYQLYDINGNLLETKRLQGIETSISLSHLVPATYFLKVLQIQSISTQKEIKIFKIIKN
jgi:hypothetical protein